MSAFDNWISHNPRDDPSPCDDCEESDGCQYDHIPEECGAGQPDWDAINDEAKIEAAERRSEE